MNIRPYKPKSEKELHALIKANLDKISLKLIQYEFKQGSDIPDFLCLDEDGKLTVIEVKLGVDKSIIMQGMRYYKMAEKYKYLIAKEYPEVRPNEEVNLVLIAENYDDNTKNIIDHLDIQLNVFTYLSIIKEDNSEVGITFTEVLISPSETLKPLIIPKIEDHIKKFTNPQLKSSYERLLSTIKKLSPGIEVNPLQKYLGLKYKGRNIATIHIRKSFFWLISFKYDEEGKFEEKVYAKVVKGDEVEVNDVIDTIKNIIKKVDSKP
ncbi:hypothetical protein LCGC14_1363680 [marine sediment metagenome]|uniref:DUF5655 domain-containing protein n=1 Tax=marine sediment metagenome TaxID=412755 RepID=A0A0F9K7E0_9ZZZZ